MKWIQLAMLLVPAVAACSSAGEDTARPSAGASHASTRDGGTTQSTGATSGRASPDRGPVEGGTSTPAPPVRRVPRTDLNGLSNHELQTIYSAIDGYVRTASIPVKLRGKDVVPWENGFDRIAPVSVVRAHHAIHHEGEHFFTCHRWYLEVMEAAIGSSLPQGRMPAWRPSNPIPAPFTSLAPPQGGDCLTQGNVATMSAQGVLCEFAYTNAYRNIRGQLVTITGLENTDPQIPVPDRYRPGDICSFPSLEDLAIDFGSVIQRTPGFHNLVHNTIGGTMQSMDSPAAAIFWPWHGTVDEIFQNWLDCHIATPPPCPAQ